MSGSLIFWVECTQIDDLGLCDTILCFAVLELNGEKYTIFFWISLSIFDKQRYLFIEWEKKEGIRYISDV